MIVDIPIYNIIMPKVGGRRVTPFLSRKRQRATRKSM